MLKKEKKNKTLLIIVSILRIQISRTLNFIRP
ncbi:hypothetical protein C7972_114135 [Arenibacter sp. ARW7G5Y1]|nr:hypothetical protein C7972_114135 [Arenibacter sp. ARW7G5Y1]